MMKTVVCFVMMLALAMAADKNQPVFSNPEHSEQSFWQDVRFVPDPNDSTGKRGVWQGWFHQDNVDVSKIDQGIIRAKVEGRWQEFQVVELPADFLKWNFDRRLSQLARMKEMMKDQRGEMPEIAGPHNGIVASHGLKRRDAYFTINNAVKGMGWLPKPEKLPKVIALLKSTWNDSVGRKLEVLESLYQHGAEIFDITKQTSLELYSRPNFETHTFLNQMADPGVAIVFLDLPKSYELRAIAQMLHPDDPKLTEYERQVVDYINLVHDYFHGASPWKSIAVIYHIVQVFDNSPGKWRGQRVVPAGER
jgi:hypothetical protein|uniref:Uncharacterized protein n=1 Tax=candidate division WOR-3 bacterium TaxID=2052148 RepID=A0A7V3V069_UNCW3